MNTSDGWRPRHVPEARGRASAARTPVDYAKIGRSSVRRRARGMTHGEAVAGLEYADPAARTAAVSSLPVPVRAHAALLAALARTGAPVDGDLEFVRRLAQADPAATTSLAAWLETAAAVKGGTA
ncbi:hypothetical protein ACPCVL_31080 [Streptomyces koyangensis]|uniref:hypothetical protein n=1 Tax=Streptomyces koyangensis TaxID=188770 RepID=UPI003C300246